MLITFDKNTTIADLYHVCTQFGVRLRSVNMDCAELEQPVKTSMANMQKFYESLVKETE